jgi:hypothetical protein
MKHVERFPPESERDADPSRMLYQIKFCVSLSMLFLQYQKNYTVPSPPPTPLAMVFSGGPQTLLQKSPSTMWNNCFHTDSVSGISQNDRTRRQERKCYHGYHFMTEFHRRQHIGGLSLSHVAVMAQTDDHSLSYVHNVTRGVHANCPVQFLGTVYYWNDGDYVRLSCALPGYSL